MSWNNSLSHFQLQQFSAFAGGGSGYYASSGPGALYYSAVQAAEAAVSFINGESIAENTEYSGNIYRDANEIYSFTEPDQGDAASSPFDRENIPDGTDYIGSYHTHGAFDPAYDNERFSPNDIGLYLNYDVLGFLGTPGGRVEMFGPGISGTFQLGCVLVGPAVPPGSPTSSSPAVPTCH